MRVYVSTSVIFGDHSFYFTPFQFNANWGTYKGHQPYIFIEIFWIEILIVFGRTQRKTNV